MKNHKQNNDMKNEITYSKIVYKFQEYNNFKFKKCILRKYYIIFKYYCSSYTIYTMEFKNIYNKQDI